MMLNSGSDLEALFWVIRSHKKAERSKSVFIRRVCSLLAFSSSAGFSWAQGQGSLGQWRQCCALGSGMYNKSQPIIYSAPVSLCEKETSGGPVVKTLTCHCRGHWFDPGSGKIPHAVGHLDPCTTAIEPVLWSLQGATVEPTCSNCWRPRALEPALLDKRSHHSEKLAQHNQRVACALRNWRKPTGSNQDPAQPKVDK